MLARVAALSALLLSACAASGCATETRYVEAPGQDDADLRLAAHSAWETAGVQAPTDYTLLFLSPDELLDACNTDMGAFGKGVKLGGCSLPGVVLLNADRDFARQATHLTHELGHLMRQHGDELDHRHLDCPGVNDGSGYGADVMCQSGAGDGALPTARDAAFVTAE